MSTIFCQQRQFGTLETGKVVTCYNLRNTSGMTVNLLNYAAILNTVQIPDIRGEMQEITLKGGPGAHHSQSGSMMLHLPTRYGINFQPSLQTIWEAESIAQDNAASIQFSTTGAVDLKYSFSKLDYQLSTEYTLTETNELIIRSQIRTSLPITTFLTHHPMWNLSGKKEQTINDHILQVWAHHYCMVDQTGFADSKDLNLEDKPSFNFEQPQRIDERRAQLPQTVDDTICFRLAAEKEVANPTPLGPLAARVKEPISGRTLEVYTNQTGLRFYLPSQDEHESQGFTLVPMPLSRATDTPVSSDLIQQETCYKLIW